MPVIMEPPPDWSLERTGARAAERLLRAKYGADLWGDINIGHIDTGIQRLPIFGPWVMIDRGVNYMEPGQPPIDPLVSARFGGHGARTLSILTGSSLQFQGVAPGVPVVPYRACDDVILGTKEELNNVARAIRHAIEVNLCEVITISLGYPLVVSPWHNVLGDAIDFAYERGIIVVAAGGQFINSPCYPGKFFRAICVGGYRLMEYPDRIRIYQNYGNKGAMRAWVDVWGPAKPVWRMDAVKDATGNVTQKPGFGDGTSFATPHVSAAAAMWLSYRRQELLATYDLPWQRVEAFRLLLQSTSENLSRYQDFKGMVPNASPARKGDTAAKPVGQGGGVQLDALLQSTIPPKSKLRFESRLAREQAV
jgi:subtilisin family serine protease